MRATLRFSIASGLPRRFPLRAPTFTFAIPLLRTLRTSIERTFSATTFTNQSPDDIRSIIEVKRKNQQRYVDCERAFRPIERSPLAADESRAMPYFMRESSRFAP